MTTLKADSNSRPWFLSQLGGLGRRRPRQPPTTEGPSRSRPPLTPATPACPCCRPRHPEALPCRPGGRPASAPEPRTSPDLLLRMRRLIWTAAAISAEEEHRQWLSLLRRLPVVPPPGQARTRRLGWAEVEREGAGDPVPHGSLRRWAQEYPEVPGQDQAASKVRLAALTARLGRRQTRRTNS